jgi:hypothetical protein
LEKKIHAQVRQKFRTSDFLDSQLKLELFDVRDVGRLGDMDERAWVADMSYQVFRSPVPRICDRESHAVATPEDEQSLVHVVGACRYVKQPTPQLQRKR